MNLVSIGFVIFLLLTLIIYFIFPKKIKWVVLLISSFIFLFYKNITVSTILQALLVLLSSYIFARLIEKAKKEKKKRLFLLFGIFIILSVLLCIKYTNLFLTILNHIFNILNINKHFSMVTKASLIGMSYYSLIMISYLIDVYRGACKSEKNVFKLALFMSYFPILTSGPFIRYENIKKDLYEGHKFNYERMTRGLLRIAWGVFKILVISQRLGYFVDAVWADQVTFNGFYSILAAMFFVLQLYTNFSGSIDIIMGVSEIIGIDLPENFNGPFFSKTITELWRRWHITLGAWLKDYIFYPLLKSDFMQKMNTFCKKKFGKKIGKKIPIFLSMFIMWLLIGTWHNGAFTFIIGSGILQFIYIFLEDILTPVSEKVNKKLNINTETFGYRLYQMIRTFLLFSFAMIFFRAPRVLSAFNFIKGMFIWNPWILLDNKSLFTAGLDLMDFRILIISLIVLFVVENLHMSGSVRDKLRKQNIVFRWIVIFALIFSIIIFGCYGPGYDPAAFIYREF